MRISQLFGRTLRQVSVEATHPTQQLLLRAGVVRMLSHGGFALLPLGMRVARRIEMLIHEQMRRIDAQEVRLPLLPRRGVAPAAESEPQPGGHERRDARSGCAAMPFAGFAKAVVELARREVTSYRQLPALLYQMQPAWQPSTQLHGNLLNLQAHTLLSVFSLDSDAEARQQSLGRITDSFERLFNTCQVEVVRTERGGILSDLHERPWSYMVLSPAGDDNLVMCPTGYYAARMDVARSTVTLAHEMPFDPPEPELVETPGCTTIAELAAFLNISQAKTARAVFFDTPERGLLFVVIRGDLTINEAKLRALAGVSRLTMSRAEQIAATGAVPGYASPVGLRDVTVVADQSVVAAGPLVAGANKAGYHLDNVLYGRDWQASLVGDIALVREGDPCPRCGSPLRIERGFEVGAVLPCLSNALRADVPATVASQGEVTYLDSDGLSQPVVLSASYLDIERLLYAIAEQHHDESGLIWPPGVAPFDVHMVCLGKSEAVQTEADSLYEELQGVGLDVLYDERQESAGVKFNDADLIGIPTRVLISDRLLKEQRLEIKPRDGDSTRISWNEVGAHLAVRKPSGS
jgi:prolyl-tRNA synthetase